MAKYRIPSDYKNDVSRATHNWRSPAYGTIHCGLAYPVHHRHLNAKDRVRGRVSALVQSQPMLGPLLNGFKLTTFGVFLPDSVIYTWMRNGYAIDSDRYKTATRYYFDPTKISRVMSGSFDYSGLQRGFTVGQDPEQTFEFWMDDFQLSSSGLHAHVGRGGLWDWLGVPAGTVAPNTKLNNVPFTSAALKWDIAPFMTYLLACYYYILNVQEGDMHVTRPLDTLKSRLGTQQVADVPFGTLVDTLSPGRIVQLLSVLQSRSYNSMNPGDISTLWDVPMNDFLCMMCHGLGAHGGLISVPYSPDLFGNIIQAGSSPSVEIPVIQADEDNDTGYAVAVPQLRFQTKIQNVVDRVFASGGRFQDILRTLWGSDSDVAVDKPDFVGVWQMSINPTNVVAQSSGSASGEDTNLGQMAARVDRYSDYGGSQGIDYYAKQPGTLMFISMLVPDPSYTQGLHPDLVARSFADEFNPEMNGVGFLSVPRHRFTTLPSNFSSGSAWASSESAAKSVYDPNIVSVGEEAAWSWLRTDYPRLHGEFAQNGVFQYWTLVRRFTEYFYHYKNDGSGDVKDITVGEYTGTYINPLSWQYLFAGTSYADPNFMLICDFDLTVTSSVSANYMPFLGK